MAEVFKNGPVEVSFTVYEVKGEIKILITPGVLGLWRRMVKGMGIEHSYIYIILITSFRKLSTKHHLHKIVIHVLVAH